MEVNSSSLHLHLESPTLASSLHLHLESPTPASSLHLHLEPPARLSFPALFRRFCADRGESPENFRNPLARGAAEMVYYALVRPEGPDVDP